MMPSLDSLSRPSPDATSARRIPAWIIPLAILGGFALLFFALFRDRLLPATDVKVAVVLATLADSNSPVVAAGNSAEASLLFQASGWIEPDPLPVEATAQVDGVVEAVHVLEGQDVKKGEPLATLISEDARLHLATAEQNQATLVATRDAHLATVLAASAKIGGAEASASAATALRDEAADRVARYEQLSSRAVSEQELAAARFQLTREQAQLRVATAAITTAEAEFKRLELETQVRENDIRTAAIAVEIAKLALARTVIPAPIDGRILRLLAAPGQKKMLQDNDAESSTIAILYQPSNLQVRVDVPLADAAGLQVGQAAHIRCSLLPDRIFTGTVTRISGEADLQRNTLQAKVRITNPAEQLRPEMLCRAEFFAMPQTGTPGGVASNTSGSVVTWIPQAAAQDGRAWVCDPESKRLSPREIKTTGETRDGHLRIASGLQPGEWVVISAGKFSPAQRVHPTFPSP